MLEATRALLEEGGPAAVTVAAVARAAKTSNGSLYHRFGDRAGLLRAAQRRAFAEMEDETTRAFTFATEALGAATPRVDVAVTLAAAAFDIFDRHRGAVRAFMIQGSDEPAIVAGTEEFLHGLAGRVTQWLVASLGARPDRAEAAWRVLLALGVSEALLDDAQVSATPLATEDLARSVGYAVLAIIDA